LPERPPDGFVASIAAQENPAKQATTVVLTTGPIMRTGRRNLNQSEVSARGRHGLPEHGDQSAGWSAWRAKGKKRATSRKGLQPRSQNCEGKWRALQDSSTLAASEREPRREL